ncbi:3-hydroxyacyl-CoA dehydrogenase [Frigidibacter sp. MR17.24]|uniref:3-hydroxyacyl-CoA dehydrogenase n=1 Tax=Frigidibacter sp. MR17.24 TaxID=3127345 RepID=UPI003012D7E3
MALDTIAVIGAGTMGRGIAQLFAGAGHPVLLHDRDPAAVSDATGFIARMLRRRAEKGETTRDAAEAAVARLEPAGGLQALAPARIVIEAVAERLDIKQALFRDLEAIVAEDAILATNTSSLMVTAIAADCRLPGRVAGCHFFNPVPLMKLVEVIRGERTDPGVVARLAAVAEAAGHLAVTTADTPGFVVNHAGRALYTEGLQLLQDNVAPPQAIDALMRDLAGFRMGPFELFDLTGIDVSGPVVESVHAQYFGDPRYRSSPIVRRRIAAGLHGRKTGAGFYRYDGQKILRPAEDPAPAGPLPARVFIAPGPAQDALAALVRGLGATVDGGATPADDALILTAPIGEDVATIAARNGWPVARCAGIDTFFGLDGPRRSLAVPVGASPDTVTAAHALFAADGTAVTMANDAVAMIAQRIVAVIVNLGCEIAQQRVAAPAHVDLAVRLGLGYPDGPLAMGDRLGPDRVLAVIEGLQRLTGDPRYRPSPWLRRRATLGLSLLTPDAL